MSYLRNLVAKFINWCNDLYIVSKEYGVRHFAYKNWYKAQKYLMWQIANSDDEQRTFVILKARQLGITTLLLAFDLLYCLEIPNAKMALIIDDYKNAAKLRQDMIFTFYPMLKKTKAKIVNCSREYARFDNGSIVQFLYTSNRAEVRGKLGRSQSFQYVHASEVAYFKSFEDFLAIQASLAKRHPLRLYIYESTANGLNLFYDFYQEAKNSPSHKAIFIGWWLKDDYIIDPKTEPKTYKKFSYPLSKEEKEWVKAVKKLYNYTIQMPQIAFWRRELYERYSMDVKYCLQELPWTEEQAFQLSGDRFFSASLILSQKTNIEALEKQGWEPEYYRIDFDTSFRITKLESSLGANLTIFEPPKIGAIYVLGADPSFAANPDSDNAVISVFKCYKDKIVQVAEFCDNQVPPQGFARYILLLATLYNGAMVNLEITGPGFAVIHELDSLRKQRWLPELKKNDFNPETIELFQENIAKIREYYYYRPDSLRRSFVRHWKTTPETKVQLLMLLKGYLLSQKIEIRSRELLEEMETVVKSGSSIEAQEGYYDDRVIACALAVETYDRYIAKMNLPTSEEKEEKFISTQQQGKGPHPFIIKIGDLQLKLH